VMCSLSAGTAGSLARWETR